MIEIDQKGRVNVRHPNIQYNEKGEPILLGTCWVKGIELECYGWADEDTLWILDKRPADPEGIPVDQYYCFNPLENASGWVMEHQVTFELSSLFGEPYRVPKV